MDTIPLQPPFRKFLRLLSAHEVRYFLVGGFAVGCHGFVRATGDMDIWQEPDNATRLVKVIEDMGFGQEDLIPELFTRKNQIVRMGIEPWKIEIHTKILGVEFGECWPRRELMEINEGKVSVISFQDLCAAKLAAGRPQDLVDIQRLPKKKR